MNIAFMLFVENLIAALKLSLQLVPFVACFWALCMGLGLNAKTRHDLLARNGDGRTMALFGLAWILISGFAPSGISMYAAAGFGTLVATLGAMIWLPDEITDVMFGKWSWVAYFFGASASYWVGIGGQSVQLGLNNVGFTQLALPTLGTTLLGMLAVVALLTRRFTDILLPKDDAGFRLMGAGLLVLIVAAFNLNPAVMISLCAVSIGAIALGGLIALPKGWTEFLVYQWWMAIPYAILAAPIYYFCM